MKLKDKRWISIFKSGTWTDASGKTMTFTEEDLDKIVKKYAQSGHAAPIAIGHPETNAPAYGWVKELKRLGKTLFAQVDQITPEFSEMVDKGLFKKRSISLYPDLTLRHEGFLGAMPKFILILLFLKFYQF